MSVRSSSYLSLALACSLVAACGEDAPKKSNDDTEVDESATGKDETETDETETDETETDETETDIAPPKPIMDAGKDSGADAGVKDTGVKDTGIVATPDAKVGDGGPGVSTGEGGTPTAPAGKGECCDDGNCLCHGPAPTALTSAAGPYKTASLRLPLGTVSYPTGDDAKPPFASVALCGGFTNTGPEMASWGPFYASHGIVTIITTTGAADDPGTRGRKLLAALEQLKGEHTKDGSALKDKLDLTRFGTSGYSMGGGGTTIATTTNTALKTSVGLAAWGPATSGVKTPTLFLCGSADSTAPCPLYSEPSYAGIQDPTPKMIVNIDGATHFSWFGPTDGGRGISGQYALAFQKVYLEGDTRWKKLLVTKPTGATMTTNIKE